MTVPCTFQVPFFPEITTSTQLRAMSKTELGEILRRTGRSRKQRCTKSELVAMACFALKIYGDSRA